MDRPSDAEILAIAARVAEVQGQAGGMQIVQGFSEELTDERPAEKPPFPPHRDLAFIEQLKRRVEALEYAPRLLGDEFAVLWGKATAAWTTGNSVWIDPCDRAGTDNGLGNVECFVISPTGDAPDSALEPEIAAEDLLAYVPFMDSDDVLRGVLVNPKWLVMSGAFNGAQDSWWTRVTQNGTRTLSTADWRGREYWISIVAYTGTEAAADAANNWVPTGDYPTRFFIGSTNAANTQISGLTSGVFQADRVYVDGTDSGKLKLTCTDFEDEHQVVVHIVASQQHPGKDGTI